MTRFAALAWWFSQRAGLGAVSGAVLGAAAGAGLLLVGCETHPGGQASAAPPSASTATDPAPRSVAFACEDGSKLTVSFAGGAATATGAQGRAIHLVQQESGSGILYEGEGYALRGKGEEIDWTMADGSALACSASASPLAGSHWELVDYRSADGRTEAPADPTKYVMALLVGGRLAMQLDCNRATGRWEAHATEGAGGPISLDAPAMTRAMCLGPSWDTRLARDLASANRYALDGERLTITLDSGAAYRWRRLPTAAEGG